MVQASFCLFVPFTQLRTHSDIKYELVRAWIKYKNSFSDTSEQITVELGYNVMKGTEYFVLL
jgi:hypothetical protein